MKTIEELGVSPAPWQWDGDERSDDMVLSAKGTVAEWMSAKDARLISAAPDLYEALRAIYEVMANGKDYLPRDWSERARAALEKAGGAE